MGWEICHFHNNGNKVKSFESKHAEKLEWLCFDMMHMMMWLSTMYAQLSVISCASITQAIFQCKKAASFSWTLINQQCTRTRFTFVAVGVCIVLLQEQLNQFRLLSYCYEHMWCLSSSLSDFNSSMCGHFWHHDFSLVVITGSPFMKIQQTGIFMLFSVPWPPCNVSLSFGSFAFTLGLLRYSRRSTALWNKGKGNIVGPWNKERVKSTIHLCNILFQIEYTTFSKSSPA